MAIHEIQSTVCDCTPLACTSNIIICSWKMTKGAQTDKIHGPSAKLLEGYSGVSKIEQPCYNAC